MTHTEISKARNLLEKERRTKQKELMLEYDKGYYAELRILQDRCEEVGHNWRFMNLNPLNNPVFCCTVCHKYKIETD